MESEDKDNHDNKPTQPADPSTKRIEKKSNQSNLLSISSSEEKVSEDKISSASDQYILQIINNSTDNPDKIPTAWEIIKQNSIITVPCMFFYILLIMLQTINLIFIGQTYNDKEMLKGIGLSHIYTNYTLFCFVYGISSGFDTLASNAKSAGRHKLMGIYLHRAYIVSFVFALVLMLIHMFTADKVIPYMANSTASSDYARKYIKIILPYILFDSYSIINMRYMNINKASSINAFILVIIGCLHFLWCYIFITILDLNVVGAGLAFITSRAVAFVCYAISMSYFNPLKSAYFALRKESLMLRGIWNYLVFSLPAMFLSCAEFWASELQAIIALRIKFEDAYEIHLIVSSIYQIIYSVHFGFSLSTPIIVASYIIKSVQATKKVILVTFLYGYGIIIFILCLAMGLSRQLITMFMERGETEFVHKTQMVFLFTLLCIFFDMGITVISSAFRGLGLQLRATLLTFVQFYLVMTVLSFVLGMVYQLGALGMWVGMSIGYFLASIAYIVMILCTNLHKVKDESIERLKRDQRDLKRALGYSKNEEREISLEDYLDDDTKEKKGSISTNKSTNCTELKIKE